VSEPVERLAGFLAGDPAVVAEVAEWVRQAAAPFRRRLAFEWEDVLQQSLADLTADLRAGRFRAEGSLRGYVWRSVNHSCLDRLRRHRRWRFEPIVELEPASPEPSPFADAARRQTSRRILALVAALPAHCRELWSMILDGLSYREMGERLAVAEGTLRVRVLRCRQQAVARWAQVTDPRPGRREDRGAEEEGVANGL
jgi:RNA polymerase sigma factor (sigma-70 family)